jgi:hypothetical protein
LKYAHVRLKLLERAYASDPALTCDIDIPMGTGCPPPIALPAAADGASCKSAVARDASSTAHSLLPVRDEDATAIFGNLPESPRSLLHLVSTHRPFSIAFSRA